MESIILDSTTTKQNVHEQKFLPNAKIFKESSLFRTSSIFITLYLQTINKSGRKGEGIDFIGTFFKNIRKKHLNFSFVIR